VSGPAEFALMIEKEFRKYKLQPTGKPPTLTLPEIRIIQNPYKSQKY